MSSTLIEFDISATEPTGIESFEARLDLPSESMKSVDLVPDRQSYSGSWSAKPSGQDKHVL